MDNVLAYVVFDLPVAVVARWLRKMFGWRQRRSEAVAVYTVLGLIVSTCLAVVWGYQQ